MKQFYGVSLILGYNITHSVLTQSEKNSYHLISLGQSEAIYQPFLNPEDRRISGSLDADTFVKYCQT
jgi:hypothetical protein